MSHSVLNEYILNENSQKQIIQKNFWKEEKTRAIFCLGLDNMHSSEKRLQKTTNLLVQEPVKEKKIYRFLPYFDPYLPNIRIERKRCKIHVWKNQS